MNQMQIDIDGVLNGEIVATPFLSKKAGAIRALAKNVARDIVEIGRHLTEAKASCAHGEWLPWLRDEFGWSSSSASRYMQVYAASLKFPTVGNLDVSANELFALAAPSTPEPVRQEILARAEEGEKLSRAEIDAMIAKAKAEVRKEEQAAKTRAVADAVANATGDLFVKNKALNDHIAAMQAQARDADAAIARAIEEKEQAIREEAERQILALKQQADAAKSETEKAKQEAHSAILRAASEAADAATAESDKAIKSLSAMVADRDKRLEALNADYRRTLDEAAKVQKMNADEVKKLRKEISEAGEVVNIITEAFFLVEKAPKPADAVKRGRKQLTHAINPSKARQVAEWFNSFVTEWESQQ